MYKISSLRKREEGQSLVEFALVFPVILLLILGMLEFGWILYNEISVTSAAREGVRIAAVTTTDPLGRATDAVYRHIGEENVTVTYRKEPNSLEAIPTAVVLVKKNVIPLIGLFYDRNIPITIDSEAVMRIE